MKKRKHLAQRLFGPMVRVTMLVAASVLAVTGQSADLEQGEELFEEHCSACHTIIERVRDKSGPNLHGIVGRKAGSEEYSGGYTPEMIDSGVTWEVATLQAFINSPALMVRGTKMVFRGLPDAQARIDLACYLERVSGNDAAPPHELCIDDP